MGATNSKYGWIRTDGRWLELAGTHLETAAEVGERDPYTAGWLHVRLGEIEPVTTMTGAQFDEVARMYAGRSLPFWLSDVDVTN